MRDFTSDSVSSPMSQIRFTSPSGMNCANVSMSHAKPPINWPPLRPLAAHPTRDASSTVTEWPRSARLSAADRPVRPAPITHTSASVVPASGAWRVVSLAVAA